MDVPYLETELTIYKTLQNEEIVFAISQLLFEYLDKEEKVKYDVKTHEILEKRKEQYLKSTRFIQEGKLEEAKKELLNLIQLYEKIENVKVQNYYDFEQMIEYILFCKTVENAKKLNVRRYPEPVTYFYYQLATIEVEEGNTYQAIEYLKKALVFNPRAMYIWEELIERYVKLQDDETVFLLAKEQLRYAYTKEQLAFLYQKLGMYYQKKAKYELSIACLIVSDHYSGQTLNKERIGKIVQVAGYIQFHSVEQILSLFQKEGINYGPSQVVVESVHTFIHYLKHIHNYDGVRYLYTIMIDLTDDDYYKEQYQAFEQEIKKHEKK